MARILLGAVICSLFVAAQCVYSASDDVVTLTPSNFQKEVVQSDSLWLIEFYAPWCGHCQRLTPEWKKAASALKGVVKLGAVDCDEHKALGGQYEIRGYPTIKVFGTNKNNPEAYQGGRTSEAIVDAALNVLRSLVKDRLGGGGGGGGGGYDSGKQKKCLRQQQQQEQQQQDQPQQQYYQPRDPEGQQQRRRKRPCQQDEQDQQQRRFYQQGGGGCQGQQDEGRRPSRKKCGSRPQYEEE